MVLVIGGIASGKRSYVRSLGYRDDDMADGWSSEAPVLATLDEALRHVRPTEEDLDAIAAKDVVICNEVGMGVVPLDRGERSWRELVGRTCTTLANRADRVVRMVCGIPTVIKG